jgi:CBS domain-containing protein
MHDKNLAAGFLRQVPPFDALDEEALTQLATQLQAAYYRKGQAILNSAQPPELAIIRKGAVRLKSESGQFLDKRSEGELFGHQAWFQGQRQSYQALAEEDSLVWHLPAAAFARARLKHPALSGYFDSELQSRVSVAAGEVPVADRVRELLRRTAVTVDAGTTVRDAARLMSEQDVSSVLVLEAGELVGIVTDRDLRQRVIAEGRTGDFKVAQIMTAAPLCIPANASSDAALLIMMRERYHHLPVLDGNRPIGLITAGDILRAQSEHPLRLVSDIHRQSSREALLALAARLPALFTRLVGLGRGVEQTGRMVTLVADAFTVHLLRLAERKLGSPPQPYAWVAFGSQARAEQSAKTDQDNGIVLAQPATPGEQEYFNQLARFVCDGLDSLGYSHCPGQVMASNPRWCVSVQEWQRHFDRWVDEPEPQAVMYSSIFFDMRCVHGSEALVDDVREHALARARDNDIFRRFMAINTLKQRPPIGFFRRFVAEDDGSHSEGLNLKHRGMGPIIDLVRMRALEAGITEPNTFRRLELAAAAGVMNAADAKSLRDALMLIGRIRLEHQARQLREGDEAGNFVPPEELSPLMRRNLKAAFMLVLEAQKALAIRYQVP